MNTSLDVYYFNNICVCCLSMQSNNNIIKLSAFCNNENNLKYSDILSTLLQYEVIDNDQLPAQICNVCSDLLTKFIQFKSECIKNLETLKAIIREEVIVIEGNNCEDSTEIIVESSEHLQLTSEKPITSSSKKYTRKSLYENFDFLYKEKQKKEPPYICQICERICNTYKSLYRHVYNHNDAKSVKCPECNHLCSKQHLKVHMRKHNGVKPFRCSICSAEFAVKFNLDRHKKSVHKSHHFNRCAESCESNRTFRHLDNHVAKCYENEYSQCHLCSNQAISSTEQKYLCDYCGKQMSSKNSLDLHIKNYCRENPLLVDKNRFCCICNKTYKASYYLRHKELCHNDKSFDCKVCGKKFSAKWYLNSHIKAHEDKSLQCNICHKKLYTKYTLTRHMLVHVGSYPFSCSICSRKFRQKVHLKTHMISHSKERKYNCNHCGKQFGIKGNLDKHIKSVHDNSTKSIVVNFCHFDEATVKVNGSGIISHKNAESKSSTLNLDEVLEVLCEDGDSTDNTNTAMLYLN